MAQAVVSHSFPQLVIVCYPFLEVRVALFLIRNSFYQLQIWKNINIIHVEINISFQDPPFQQSGASELAARMNVIYVKLVTKIRCRIEQSKGRERIPLAIAIAKHVFNVILCEYQRLV